MEFVHLRQRTGLTDGNLASHAKRLADGGLIDIDKQFRGGKPVTTYALTSAGEHSLKCHIDGLMSAITADRTEIPPAFSPAVSAIADEADDWVD